ncbi:hypothetical protein HBI47_046550 [Parastagonospora nodorum]|nr:hypothetical protein HBI48_039050 [Parastagonospora nodorum]KAH5439527.1 hypothetical protein HBI47_046550 [Parastagonospora nodorum]
MTAWCYSIRYVSCFHASERSGIDVSVRSDYAVGSRRNSTCFSNIGCIYDMYATSAQLHVSEVADPSLELLRDAISLPFLKFGRLDIASKPNLQRRATPFGQGYLNHM